MGGTTRISLATTDGRRNGRTQTVRELAAAVGEREQIAELSSTPRQRNAEH
jgi:hypothetical protein